MKKMFLIKNPELFQGEKYLTQNKNYFEGWYFKNSNKEKGISFIPGINIEKNISKAFIQVLTNDISYFINYNIKDFKFTYNPFSIKIGDNFFSKDGIHIDIKDKNLKIYGDIKYYNATNIKTSLINPNIMGPFSYIPFMECNHAILSMQSKANGKIYINEDKIEFNNDNGYIEKDWGISFPKSYIWCQGNNFRKSDASFMLSLANIPLKAFEFKGIICVLLIGNKEYKFTTYNNTKILEYKVNNNTLDIKLKKGNYFFNIRSKLDRGQKLFAPVNGKMSKDIFESISATITIILKQNSKTIFYDESINCGLEIVK